MRLSRLVFCLFALLLPLSLAAATRAVFDNHGVLSLGDGSALWALHAGDMTGDGRPDIVALASNGSPLLPRLYVYPSQGDGTFAAPRITTLDSPSHWASGVAVDIADLDADGKLDVAFAYPAHEAFIRIYRGVGDGTFTSGALLSSSRGCYKTSLRLADLTNDGRPEVLLCGVSVFLNLGSGNFSTEISTNAGDSQHFFIGDADGNGYRDMFTGGSASVSVRPGNGNGTFDAPSTIMADGPFVVTDLNGDGRSDVAFVDRVRHDLAIRFASLGGTYLTRHSAGFVGEAHEVRLLTSDMNSDGRPDLIACQGASVSVWLTNADGTPGPANRYATPVMATLVAAADFDGDGATDVIAGGKIENRPVVAFMRGAAGGTLHAVRAHVFSRTDSNGFLNSEGLGQPALFDVTGDGKVDAITVASWKQTVMVLPGNGDGTAGAAIDTDVKHDPYASVLEATPIFADFDGNDVVDVALVATDDTWVDCWLANGDGTFRQSGAIDKSTWSSRMRAGDFDGDGNQDLIEVQPSTIHLYAGNGDGTFAAPVFSSIAWHNARITGDLNGDGADDVITDAYVLLGSSSRTFTRVADSRWVDVSPAAVADLDGDEKLDLVQVEEWVGHGSSGTVWIRLGAGDGTFGIPRRLLAKVGGPAVAGDFDADGNTDLLFGTQVLLGDGEGAFRSHVRLLRGDTSFFSAVGDVDGNGSSDLLIAGRGLEIVRTSTTDSREVPIAVTIGTVPPVAVVGERVEIPVSASSAGTFAPTGAVTVGIDGKVVSFAELVDGAATANIIHEAVGMMPIAAAFGGDEIYAASATSSASQEATRTQTYFDFYPSPVPVVKTEIHIKGFISSPTVTRATGTVTVSVDGVVRGTGSAPNYDIPVGMLAAGSRVVRVQYEGDALHLPFDSSETHFVEKLTPSIAVTASPSGSANVGTPVTITATLADAAATGEVWFYANSTKIGAGAISSGTASFTTSALMVGSKSLVAFYRGDADYATVAGGIKLTVVDTPLPPSASSLYLITPCRILDTRNDIGPWGGPAIAKSETRAIQMAGQCGVPAGAKAIAVNVTAVAPANTGYLALFPGASTYPGTSTVNYRAGKTRASSIIVPLSAGGIVKMLNGGPSDVHAILDVTAYFQ